MFQRIVRIAAVSVAMSLAATSLAPAHAEAQDPVQQRSGHKGLFSLGIIGAELGLVIPAAAGLDDWWALLVFPAVGAAGGALAGHYLLDNNNHAQASTAILAISIALVIPSVVLTLALRAYDPDDDAQRRGDEGGAPSELEVEVEAEAAARRRSQSIARAGTGLLRRSEYGLHLGIPAVEVSSTRISNDPLLAAFRPSTEVRISLFSGVF